MRNTQPYDFKKLILCLSLTISNYVVFAQCDPETDPFCEGDVDAPIDEQILLLLISGFIMAYSAIVKKYKLYIKTN
jgi:hypothetical protein